MSTVSTRTDETPASRRRFVWVAAIVALALVAAAAIAIALTRSSDTSAADDGMNQRAAAVMPFDLEATSHTFTKTDSGGVETVVATNDADTHNIDLIRSHLAMEAQAFRRGDFSDPAKIHGMNMPGLKELDAGASRVDVRYDDIEAGGRITYSSTEPALVDALHAWFDRQNTDHAMPGMGG
jgi:hypothetical protein